jgi:hypothetical protein
MSNRSLWYANKIQHDARLILGLFETRWGTYFPLQSSDSASSPIELQECVRKKACQGLQ